MMLTKEDLGPRRKAFDKGVRYVVVFLLGWMVCEGYWHVNALPALKADSSAWFSATSDKFAGICDTIYGANKTPAINETDR